MPSDGPAIMASRTVRMLRTAFGPAIGQLLDEPDIVEVRIDADGQLSQFSDRPLT